MKLKYIAAIFLYFATFTLSVLIVGIPRFKSEPANIRPSIKQPVRSTEPELEARLRKFLQADKQTGRELSEDLSKFRAVYVEVPAKKLATGILVKKMQSVDCLNLPDDFCAAWKEHVDAWSKKHDFLRQAHLANRQSIDKDLTKDYLLLTGEINRTYYRMLDVARRYNVDFNY
jgi:hypothetical protein